MSQIQSKFLASNSVTAAKVAANAIDETKLSTSVAGDGLTGGGGTALAVGAGDGIDVTANAIAVDVSDLAGTGLENDGSNNLRIAAAAAGAGLTGGAGSALAVGAGSGITVAADSVAVDATVVRTNGANAFTADQSMGGNDLTNVGSVSNAGGTLALDASTTISILSDDVTVLNAGLYMHTADETASLQLATDSALLDTADGSLNIGAGSLTLTHASTVVLQGGAGTISANSKTIQDVATPVGANDATNKAYVDAAINGLDWKQSVRVATTTAGTLASDFENGDTVDGITLATGDRILLKNQATGSQNGIYTVNASGAPTRATDADADAEVTAGLAVFVEAGTVNSDTGWVLTTDGAIVVDTTALTFAQFTGAGAITAGAGLTKTGNTLDVGAGDGITVAADSIAVDTTAIAGTGLENDGSNNLRIAASAAGAGLTGGAGSALAVGAGTAVTVNANDVAVRVDGTTVKANGSNNLEALKKNDELMTLISGDITNQYVDLDFAAHSAESISLTVIGGIMQERGADYTVSLTGGSGGVTRITFDGDLATGGDAALIATDKLVVSYSYL